MTVIRCETCHQLRAATGAHDCPGTEPPPPLEDLIKGKSLEGKVEALFLEVARQRGALSAMRAQLALAKGKTEELAIRCAWIEARS